jgi:hypothetical protein
MDMPQSKRNENRYFYGNEAGERVVIRLGGVSDLIRSAAGWRLKTDQVTEAVGYQLSRKIR